MAHTLSDILKGLRRGEFRVALEPQIDLLSGRVLGVECLARWQHPEQGLLSPLHFLPPLERHGLMTPLTLEVLRRALAIKKSLRGSTVGRISINLSASSLMDWTFAHEIERIAAELDEPLTGLVFELTESAALTEESLGHECLLELSRLGISLSLDDFWTGYSSLDKPHLDRFDEIKIDHKLTSRIGNDRIALAGLASIISFGSNLGWRCVVEGIEDAGTLKRVRDLGGRIGQGYHFSRPLLEQEFLDWLQAWPRRAVGMIDSASLSNTVSALRFDEEEKRGLQDTRTPVWLFNLDSPRMEWANAAALDFWLAESLDELLQRDFRSDLSPTARQRLEQLRHRLSFEHSLADQWTVFPRGQPRPSYSVFERRIGEDGAFLVLVRAYEGFRDLPMLRLKGELADASPIAMMAFGADGTLQWRNLAAGRQFLSDQHLIQQLFESREAAEAFIETVFLHGEAHCDQRVRTRNCVMWHRIQARLFRDPETGRWTALSAHMPICDLRGCSQPFDGRRRTAPFQPPSDTPSEAVTSS